MLCFIFNENYKLIVHWCNMCKCLRSADWRRPFFMTKEQILLPLIPLLDNKPHSSVFVFAERSIRRLNCLCLENYNMWPPSQYREQRLSWKSPSSSGDISWRPTTGRDHLTKCQRLTKVGTISQGDYMKIFDICIPYWLETRVLFKVKAEKETISLHWQIQILLL